MQRESRLTCENIHALKQGLALIEQLDDELYSDPLPPFFNYGVGSHFRHLLDFYNCFLAGVESGRIDYDSRERGELVERDRLAAKARISSIIDFLESLPPVEEQRPVIVRAEDPTAGLDPSGWSCSSLRRELQFLLSHTVHHYALIALMLR
ncbi:MAG TPA: DinB family protein, partial [Blastocatellia bacterium]|nr:DinB family protein [Blastocatellia bacterium]